MRIPILAIIPLTIALASCGQSADPDVVLDTIRLTEQARLESFAAKDVGGVVRHYHDDAIMMAPDTSVAEGSDAIAQRYDLLLEDPHVAIAITPGQGWASSSGDLATTSFTGQFTVTHPATGEARTTPISNSTVWRRPDGGAWQIVSDYTVALNTDDAEVAATTNETSAN